MARENTYQIDKGNNRDILRLSAGRRLANLWHSSESWRAITSTKRKREGHRYYFNWENSADIQMPTSYSRGFLFTKQKGTWERGSRMYNFFLCPSLAPRSDADLWDAGRLVGRLIELLSKYNSFCMKNYEYIRMDVFYEKAKWKCYSENPKYWKN